MFGTTVIFLLAAFSSSHYSHADPIHRNSMVKRALESSSLISSHTDKKEMEHNHKKLRLRFASREEEKNGIFDNTINDTAEDYDFVLDLNEHDDFDRLLNMLSRSGPAKQEKKHKPKKSSTFVDRHDEKAQADADALVLASYKGKGFPSKARKIVPEEEGSKFEDLQREKEEREQKRLEALYFENIHDQRRAQETERKNSKVKKANSGSIPALSLATLSLSLLSILL